MTDRIKLSPIIIFKFVNVLQEEFSNEVIIYVNFQGWINKNEIS